eukprot:TRINITY_DN1692_c0_g1_i12.p1 TRINITY_DN1692_c0_g1~~TRINITY_DN1692_c0_g1_i12.p1  ORF type:complete len:407 (+),score=104.98 TRINITY_DN1692_c0_g1_i12:562-1782(+)
MIVFGAIVALWSMYLLMDCSFKTNQVKYSELVGKTIGKGWAKFFEIVIIIYSFGSIVCYQITISTFFPTILVNFGVDPEFANKALVRDAQIILFSIMIFPLALVRNLYGLRYATMLGVVAVFYIVIVVVLETAPYHHLFWDPDNIKMAEFSLDTLTAFAVTAFAYTCHTNIFPIRKELSRAAEHRMQKIFNRAVAFETILYLTVAFAGFWSLGNTTPDLIIQRPPLAGSRDILMTIGRVAITLNLVIALPININPCRMQILTMMGKDEPFNKSLHLGITAILLFGSAGLAIIFPDIISAFSILGGSCSVMLSMTFPGILYLKLSKDKWTHPRNLLFGTMTFLLSLAGFAATAITLLQKFGVLKAREQSKDKQALLFFLLVTCCCVVPSPFFSCFEACNFHPRLYCS